MANETALFTFFYQGSDDVFAGLEDIPATNHSLENLKYKPNQKRCSQLEVGEMSRLRGGLIVKRTR